jgi:hypothetical protein
VDLVVVDEEDAKPRPVGRLHDHRSRFAMKAHVENRAAEKTHISVAFAPNNWSPPLPPNVDQAAL